MAEPVSKSLKLVKTPVNDGVQSPETEIDGSLSLPRDVVLAAMLLTDYFKSQGIAEWALMGVQSRREESCEHVVLLASRHQLGLYTCEQCGKAVRL